MPGRDGSGPQGQGQRSGRGLGPCGSGNRQVNNPTNNQQPMGTGSSRGMGSGQAPGGRGLGQRIADGFNNLRQRARTRRTRRGSGRKNIV